MECEIDLYVSKIKLTLLQSHDELAIVQAFYTLSLW